MKSVLAIISIGLLSIQQARGRRANGDATRPGGLTRVPEYYGTTERGDGSVQDDDARTTRVRSRMRQDLPSKRRMSCPIGTYNDPLGPSCQPCPLGSYADEEASDRCTLCPSGSYAPITGASFCLPCDPSYYDGPGSDYGYTGVSAAASMPVASPVENVGDEVVYCVAPLYPVDDTDDWTPSTDSPTSSTPSTIPTLSPSAFSSSSPPSAVPSIDVSLPPPTTVPTSVATSTSHPTRSRSPESHRPLPWNMHRTPAPSQSTTYSPTATPPPTVRHRWNFAEDARSNRTDGGQDEEEDGPRSVVEEADHRLRPFLPLLALTAAMTISGGALAIKMWRQQQQQRRQLVTKSYSLRPASLPPSAATPPSPPPPALASASSMDLSFLSCQQQEGSDDRYYWSDDSSFEDAECPSRGSGHSLAYDSSGESASDSVSIELADERD